MVCFCFAYMIMLLLLLLLLFLLCMEFLLRTTVDGSGSCWLLRWLCMYSVRIISMHVYLSYYLRFCKTECKTKMFYVEIQFSLNIFGQFTDDTIPPKKIQLQMCLSKKVSFGLDSLINNNNINVLFFSSSKLFFFVS